MIELIQGIALGFVIACTIWLLQTMQNVLLEELWEEVKIEDIEEGD